MMKKKLVSLMWLFGIVALLAPAAQAQPKTLPAAWMQAEELTYSVSLGLLQIGQATLKYVPGAGGRDYTITARVRDSVPLYDINDVWTMQGRHGAQLFQSVRADIKQEEGSYKARKTLEFGEKTVRYQKVGSPESTVTVPMVPGLRDVFSALYLLRTGGLENAKKSQSIQVIAGKEAFPLTVAAAVKDQVSVRGRTVEAWRVRMSVFYPAEKKRPARTETWDVWVLPDARLTPVRIEARLKLGGFTAVLR